MTRTLLVVLAACLALAGCDLLVSPEKRVERAAALIDKGDYRAAAIELRNALQKAPDNARGRLLMAQTAYWLGDLPAAKKELERALDSWLPAEQANRLDAEIKLAFGEFEAVEKAMASKPAGLDEWQRLAFLGEAQLGQRKVDAAQATFASSVNAAPAGRPSAEARRAQAEGLAAAGDTQAALDLLGKVIADDPAYPQAVLSKAGLLLQRGEYAAAEAALVGLDAGGAAKGLDVREQLGVLSGLVEAQLAQRKLDEAGKSIEKLGAIAPGTPALAYLQGRLALAQGRGEEAVTAFQTAVKGAPGFLPAKLMLGVALLSQGSVAQAEAILQEVIRSAPDNVEARKLLAQAQISQGRGGAASEVLSPVLASASGDAQLYTLAGRAKVLTGEREEGEALFERGLVEGQDDPKARLEIAGSYLSAGDTKRALEILATVPDDAGGQVKRQMQFLAMATGKDKAVAKLEVEQLIERNPKDVQLLNLAAGWLAAQGDTDAARRYLQQALAADSKDARTYVNLGRLEYGAKRVAEARKAFESAIAAAPATGEAYLALAGIADSEGDAAAAKRWLERWREADGKAAQPRMLLARRAFQAKDAAGGRRLLDEALKVAPNSAPVEGAAGEVLMEAAAYDEALGHFRKASEIDGRSPQYLLGAARAQLALNQREAARESLNRALTVRSDWPPAIIMLAGIELRDKRTDAALALADRLKRKPETAAAGYALEGDVRMSAGEPAAAVVAYSESTKLRPTPEAAYGEYVARNRGKLDRPEEPLLRQLERTPDDARTRLVLAQHYDSQGLSKQAIAEYEKVLKVAPNSAIALNNLAWHYFRNGDPRAESMARQAHGQAPNAAAIADTLGWILVSAGKAEEGAKYIQQAYDSDKENAEIKYHLGVAMLKTGRQAEGRRLIEEAITAGGTAQWVAEAKSTLGGAD
jgi:putative PEP-CTERM system TPR-repeat lipoprotein